MSGCPFTHPLDLDAYRDGMPYAALAEARAQGSFVRYEDPDTLSLIHISEPTRPY